MANLYILNIPAHSIMNPPYRIHYYRNVNADEQQTRESGRCQDGHEDDAQQLGSVINIEITEI